VHRWKLDVIQKAIAWGRNEKISRLERYIIDFRETTDFENEVIKEVLFARLPVSEIASLLIGRLERQDDVVHRFDRLHADAIVLRKLVRWLVLIREEEKKLGRMLTVLDRST